MRMLDCKDHCICYSIFCLSLGLYKQSRGLSSMLNRAYEVLFSKVFFVFVLLIPVMVYKYLHI